MLMLSASGRSLSVGCRKVSVASRRSSAAVHVNRKTTHYDVLQLSQNCTQEQIREAYLQLSKQYHPDAQSATHRNSAKLKEMSAVFVRINEAYQVLGKPNTRRDYDAFLSGRPSQHSGYQRHNPSYHRADYRNGYRNAGNQQYDGRWQSQNRWSAQSNYDPYSEEAEDEVLRYIRERRRNGVVLCVYVVLFSVSMHLVAYSFARNLTMRDQEERKRRFSEFYDVDEETHRRRLFSSIQQPPR